MTYPTKKLEELKCAKFFINRFNKQYNLDYRVKPNKNENRNRFIDVYAHSVSKKHPILNLQITIREGVLYRDFAENRIVSKQTGI